VRGEKKKSVGQPKSGRTNTRTERSTVLKKKKQRKAVQGGGEERLAREPLAGAKTDQGTSPFGLRKGNTGDPQRGGGGKATNSNTTGKIPGGGGPQTTGSVKKDRNQGGLCLTRGAQWVGATRKRVDG